jgi:hypothetical protein
VISIILALAIAAQTPDSARQARYERTLNNATDALDRLRGAAADFRADLPSASTDLILQRAERVRGSCRDAGAAVIAVDSLLAEGPYDRNALRQQAELRSGGTAVRRALTRCERDWNARQHRTATVAADSLRAWGPHRTSQLEVASSRYLAVVRGFMKKAGLKKPATS